MFHECSAMHGPLAVRYRLLLKEYDLLSVLYELFGLTKVISRLHCLKVLFDCEEYLLL